MQLRKAKGLCFNYDEKFSPSHRCQNMRLLLLQWDEEPFDDKEEEKVEYEVDLQSERPIQNEETSPNLSLNAMNSVAASGTMRFTGFAKGNQ